ncbi:sensor histidine kinase [Fournierella massiliensis]|uniref:sensor histidine kinase n=1 Tax=Allofournierella massiliensis TaxID=1650663 RepID=UPI00352026C9
MNTFLFTSLWLSIDLIYSHLFFDSFFPKRSHSFQRLLLFPLFVIVGTILLIFSPSTITPVVTILLFSLANRFLHTTSKVHLIFFSIIVYSIGCTIDNLVFTSFLAFSGWHYTTLQSSFPSYIFLSIFSHGLPLLFCFALNRLRKRKHIETSNWNWYFIPVALSFVCIIMEFYLNSCFRYEQIESVPLSVCAAFITMVNIASLLLVSWVERTSHLREESLFLHAQIKAQSEGIEALSLSNTTQRKLTHDFRAHLEMLDSLLENQSFQEAADYITRLRAEQTERILLVNTHNSAMDAILNQKALIAKKHDIDVQFAVNDLSPLLIDAVDLTVIISNLMDNAIEACEKLPIHERQIHVKALLEDAFFFSIRNRSEPVQVCDNMVITTKPNTLLHGYGLQNVRSTLNKYDSYFGIDYQNGWFLAYAEIQNTPLS